MKRKNPLLTLILMVCLVIFVFPLSVSAEEEEIIMEGIGFFTLGQQRLYSDPDVDSEVLAVSEKHDCVVIVETVDDTWSKVIYDLQEGYVYSACLDIRKEVLAELGAAVVNSDIVYIRSGPGTEYSILISGYRNREFRVIGMDNGWYKILFKKKNQQTYATGYVRSDLLDLATISPQNAASEEEPQYYYLGTQIGEPDFEESKPVAMAAPGSKYVPISGNYLLAQAQKYLGTPYVFGGYSPDGFDCSGLIYYILDQVGYPVPRTAADQYSMGRSVSRDSLIPGDLVFFANTYTSGISHVGVYAGNNQFIHAPNEGGSVCYSKLSGYWANHYHGARRIG